MGGISRKLLQAVLMSAAIFVVVTGADQALGGLYTLGLLEQAVYFEVVDQGLFEIMDNHARFIGGVWMGVGLVILVGLTNLAEHRSILNVALALAFVGGLARLSQMNVDVLFDPSILWALTVEIVGMPLLALWLAAEVRRSAAAP